MLKKLYCRCYQLAFLLAGNLIIPWREPQLITGPAALEKLAALIAQTHKSVLVVTDRGLQELGLVRPLLAELALLGVHAPIYDKTSANPTIHNVEQALEMYKAHQCSAVVAFGGGSPMDCAKVVAARAGSPSQSVSRMRGVLRVRRKPHPIYAVPTTAGTGSEATLAAVVTDTETKEKYAINDPKLIPAHAVLDPTLTKGLPPHLTAATGMDAVTHAVEAYIGRSNTAGTRANALKAIELLFTWLPVVYESGDNLEAREKVQWGAYYAGLAFTRAYVGNVHAMAHALGAYYSLPHGQTNATILPYVLERYGSAAHKPLAGLARAAGITAANEAEAAHLFIEKIRELNRRFAIPAKIAGIQQGDIPALARHAEKETNPLYPVPVIWGLKEYENLYREIAEETTG